MSLAPLAALVLVVLAAALLVWVGSSWLAERTPHPARAPWLALCDALGVHPSGDVASGTVDGTPTRLVRSGEVYTVSFEPAAAPASIDAAGLRCGLVGDPAGDPRAEALRTALGGDARYAATLDLLARRGAVEGGALVLSDVPLSDPLPAAAERLRHAARLAAALAGPDALAQMLASRATGCNDPAERRRHLALLILALPDHSATRAACDAGVPALRETLADAEADAATRAAALDALATVCRGAAAPDVRAALQSDEPALREAAAALVASGRV